MTTKESSTFGCWLDWNLSSPWLDWKITLPVAAVPFAVVAVPVAVVTHDAVEAGGRYSAGKALAGCGVDEAVGATCNGAGSLGEALDGSGVGNTH